MPAMVSIFVVNTCKYEIDITIPVSFAIYIKKKQVHDAEKFTTNINLPHLYRKLIPSINSKSSFLLTE